MQNNVFGGFPKILQNLSEGQVIVSKSFQKMFEDFPR